LIIIECLIIASKARNLSGRLICVGMMAWIGFQTYTNIAVATGLFPNTGITLPFFSRGVSSLISVYIGLGIVLNVALQRRT
jgi:rod shape determining protein RodA